MILFIFLDGVGLGSDDGQKNPFVFAEMPNMQKLLQGQKLLASTAPFIGEEASLLSIDACLGVTGLPQSATGQSVLLTGRNIPYEIGYHYGPKPDKATAAYLSEGGLFGTLNRSGKRVALVNAYPDMYFEGINSGKRLYSAIPQAAVNAGLRLFRDVDLLADRAISADFTAAGWHERKLAPDVKILHPFDAGKQLATLASDYDFAFFEYWLTDYAGHNQNLDEAVILLEKFDVVLGGLLNASDENLLILITSDHGNIEDLSTRRHTENHVPLLLIGDEREREYFDKVIDLTGVYHAILKALI